MINSDYVKIPKSFYEKEDVVKIAKELLGKYLITCFDGHLTGGMIVETEAYNGRIDKASHAFNKKTPRTEVIYQPGGVAYVYLCYGIHHLFNIVTNKQGYADAVLIRALEPTFGVEIMSERHQTNRNKLTNGPGKLSKALGITKSSNGMALNGNLVYLVKEKSEKKPKIAVGKRIGIDYAEEDALLPWRFYMPGNGWVSK